VARDAVLKLAQLMLLVHPLEEGNVLLNLDFELLGILTQPNVFINARKVVIDVINAILSVFLLTGVYLD